MFGNRGNIFLEFSTSDYGRNWSCFSDCRVDLPGIYLVLPVIWGRSITQVLNFVIDKVKRRMLGWLKKLLSEAGREVLIKAVVNSIPVYPMSCFLFPKSILQ